MEHLMDVVRHAIMVAPCAGGWEWRLVDPDGLIAACGFATTQRAAMQTAWSQACVEETTLRTGRAKTLEFSLVAGR